MPQLANPQWERFCQAYALHQNAAAAYRDAGYSAKTPDVQSKVGARMVRRAVIRARVDELRAPQTAQLERDGARYSMTRQGMAETLIRIIQSPPEQASLSNPLCEVRYVGKEGRMVAAFPDKVRCAELLCKLLGWSEPLKINVSVDPLQSLLNSIRARVESPSGHAYELPEKKPRERTLTLPLSP